MSELELAWLLNHEGELFARYRPSLAPRLRLEPLESTGLSRTCEEDARSSPSNHQVEGALIQVSLVAVPSRISGP